ncbi:MAG: hypothetical protein JW990_03470 [Thermoleophilia bacterium]|nr:hypothetical protein [Thermoleophilia bacterium]
MVNRGFILVNIDMDYLPLMERWLLRDHAAEFMSVTEPFLRRYISHRAVPAPECAELFGYYNWRLTEVWMSDDAPGFAGALPATWPEKYAQITEHDFFSTVPWGGRPQGPHPAVQATIPVRPTETFSGADLHIFDGNILRWFSVFKYPEGVSVEEGEDWFLNTHAKEVVQQPGLRRFISYRVEQSMPGRPPSPFHRVSEHWYEGFHGWRESVFEAPPVYAKPPWSGYDRYPFLEPYADFVSTFILEKPTNDFLRDYRGYVCDV